MLTCPAGRNLAESEKGAPEQFFVAMAIKACYGKLPDFGQVDLFENQASKRARLDESTAEIGVLDAEYRRLYCELRDSALGDMRTLVQKYVEGMSTLSGSYDFMNIYGLCSFNPPAPVKNSGNEPPICKFTKVTAGEQHNERLISVTGLLNPLVASRVSQGQHSLAFFNDSS